MVVNVSRCPGTTCYVIDTRRSEDALGGARGIDVDLPASVIRDYKRAEERFAKACEKLRIVLAVRLRGDK